MKDSVIIATLKERIDKLQISFDSLKVTSDIRQLQYELHQKQDIITQINEFYDSAWIKLLIVISILGILVPIIAQYYQRKNLKDLSEFIRNQMNDGFDRRMEELERVNKQKIDQSLSELKGNISEIEVKNNNLVKELDASTLYFQGKALYDNKKFHFAIPHYFKSAYLWLNSDRPERSRVLFANLLLCLKCINDKDLLEISSRKIKDSGYDMTIDELMQYLNDHERKNIYEDQFEDMQSEIKRIYAL